MGGNWKLNPTKMKDAVQLAAGLVPLVSSNKDVDVAIFPPSPFLVPVFDQIKNSNIKVTPTAQELCLLLAVGSSS